MRKLQLLMLVVLSVCVSASAQSANEELQRLRQHLNVEDGTTITVGEAKKLPKDSPLKVYLAFGLDVGVKGNFNNWLAEWNRKDGKRYGMVEIVSDIAQAQVILARYVSIDKTTERSTTRTVSGVGTVYDPATNQVITRPVPITSSNSYSVVPAYAYVISRTSQGLEILWRYVGDAPRQETKDSGKQLRDDFIDMLKTRSKK